MCVCEIVFALLKIKKCTLAGVAVWVELIGDGGVNVGLLSALRRLGPPEGGVCCINSDVIQHFQFDPDALQTTP